jgi:hypothetical protein
MIRRWRSRVPIRIRRFTALERGSRESLALAVRVKLNSNPLR